MARNREAISIKEMENTLEQLKIPPFQALKTHPFQTNHLLETFNYMDSQNLAQQPEDLL
jgi:hypothetical protein